MAGFYDELLKSTNADHTMPAVYPIFGNAATTPAIVSSSQANIDNLQSQVNNYQNQLNAAQNAYNTYLDSLNANTSGKNKNNENNEKLLKSLAKKNGTTKDTLSDLSSQYATAVSDAQTGLTKAQNSLNDALNRQASQIASGQSAVQWGQNAKAAEEQGLRNAQQMYNNLMSQWANNFIGVQPGGGSNGNKL